MLAKNMFQPLSLLAQPVHSACVRESTQTLSESPRLADSPPLFKFSIYPSPPQTRLTSARLLHSMASPKRSYRQNWKPPGSKASTTVGDIQDRARLRPTAAPHAGAWLSSPATGTLGLHLTTSEFAVAVLLRLGGDVLGRDTWRPRCDQMLTRKCDRLTKFRGGRGGATSPKPGVSGPAGAGAPQITAGCL